MLPLLIAGTPSPPLTISIDPEPWRLYGESIARNQPEEVALIAGRLDEPLHITDFFFIPPHRRDGRFAHGSTHIEIDHEAMNYVIDRVLVPNDKYILGLWHSHPGGCTAPSEADRRFFAAVLRNDDSPGQRWPFFLAPITTFDADGRDRVTAWVMRKGTDTFELAVFEPPSLAPIALSVPEVPVVTATPPVAPPMETDAPLIDPLSAIAARLGAILARPDGPIGVPRHRIAVCLQSALSVAEFATDADVHP